MLRGKTVEIISSGMVTTTLLVKILAATQHTMIVKTLAVGVTIPLRSQRKAALVNLLLTEVFTLSYIASD